jgi:hypothetical protein
LGKILEFAKKFHTVFCVPSSEGSRMPSQEPEVRGAASSIIPAKSLFAAFVVIFALCILMLPRRDAEQVAFLEKLAITTENAKQLPRETQEAILRLLDETRYRRATNPTLESRQRVAVQRIEAALQNAAGPNVARRQRDLTIGSVWPVQARESPRLVPVRAP